MTKNAKYDVIMGLKYIRNLLFGQLKMICGDREE